MGIPLLSDADDILRGHPWVLQRESGTLRRLLQQLVFWGATYGVTMGAFGLFAADAQLPTRGWQMLYAGLKVPMLLTVTFSICLPSFFVINTLVGLRDDFAEVLRALMAAQAAISIVLASFAPLTILWYVSNDDYEQALLFNLVVFGSASLVGQGTLRRSYAGLICKYHRHSKLLNVWILLYAFVGVQMGWVLRPFIGSAGRPVEFFRPEAWDNAYLHILNLIAHVLFA